MFSRVCRPQKCFVMAPGVFQMLSQNIKPEGVLGATLYFKGKTFVLFCLTQHTFSKVSQIVKAVLDRVKVSKQNLM